MSRFRPITLHYACFTCRKSFSREANWETRKMVCPHCGGTAHMMGRWFKPPPRSAVKQWQGLEALVMNGYPLSHYALNDVEKFLDEQDRRKLESDPQRRFLLHLKERPRRTGQPSRWRARKPRKGAG